MSMFDPGGATVGTGAVRTAPPPQAAPAGPPVDANTRRMYQMYASYLRGLGLGELATVDANGNPSGWLWQQIIEGIDSAEELRMAIEQTSAWRDQFGVIVEQRRRAAAGQPVQIMSVEEVVAYRAGIADQMRQAGLPQWMYDEREDVDQYILGGLSPAEVGERLGDAFERASTVAPEVRRAFEDFYGVGQGEGALAAYFLNPERTMASLDRASRTAYAAGMGARYGIGIDRARAERIAGLPMTEAGITQGLEQVNRMGAVFTEGLGETNDLTAGREGVDLVFEGNSDAQSAIARRIGTRRSGDRSSTGGAAMTNQGLVGSGSV